jgi:hypothetical protein
MFHPRLNFSKSIIFSIVQSTLGMPVSKVSNANAKRLDLFITKATLYGQEVLVVKDVAEATLKNSASAAHVFGMAEGAPIDRAQGTECNSSAVIVETLKRFCRE